MKKGYCLESDISPEKKNWGDRVNTIQIHVCEVPEGAIEASGKTGRYYVGSCQAHIDLPKEFENKRVKALIWIEGE